MAQQLLMAIPALGSIVAISSAVYFLRFYFFLAVLAFWEYEKFNGEIIHAK